MPGVDLTELGGRIRQRRRALGWTQEELAAQIDVEPAYIGSIERGERNLTFIRLCQLSEALRCDVATLTEEIPTVLSRHYSA